MIDEQILKAMTSIQEAASVKQDLGILSPRIFTMMVLMALITTFMAGPVLTLLSRLAQRSEGQGLRHAPSEAGPP